MEKYKKIKIVGKGSFGFAVLVESRKNKKQFIIKIIDISKMDEKQIEEALTQVQVLKVMRYPYVVSYRQSFMQKMCLCIVMDYCEGGDMFNKIAKQKQMGTLFTESQILTWFVQMALALKHVHDRKILHRDLKTQNIFLNAKGQVKIGDFGIARVLQHTYDCANTAIGTPYYLSPQICQQKPYNQKSDIWSLGCILYQLTTLNHAFDAQNMKGLVQKILKGTYPPIPQIYSNDLRKLISELLIKDPNKRPSIRKILQMPFLKARVNQLFSNTLQLHQFQFQKEGTSIIQLKNLQPTQKKEQQTQKKIDENNFKKIQKNVTKIDPISKNSHAIQFTKKNQQIYFSKNNQDKCQVTKKQSTNQKNCLILQKKSKQFVQSKQNRGINVPYPIQLNLKKKPKQIDQDQTLQQQGYNQLLTEMKNFIHGNNTIQQQKQIDFGSDNIIPKFLNVNGEKFTIPGMNERDTTGSKIQALRIYLQKEIGAQFIKVYKAISNETNDDFIQAKKILGEQKSKYIPLILQLIVCEDNYY